MPKEYFNKLETDNIFKLKKTNPILALKKYEHYLKEYPNDYYTYCFYIDTLISLGRFNKASDEIEKAKEVAEKNNYFLNLNRKYSFDQKIHYQTLRLLFFGGKYYECLQYIENYGDSLVDVGISIIKLLCKKRLGNLNLSREDGYSYLHKQIIEYDENEFLEHVKKHFTDSDVESKIENYFISDFPVLDVLKEIKKYIPSDKSLSMGLNESRYYFKFDNCGRYNKKIDNFIEVICIYGTSDIITMYPVLYGENLPYVDLNYMIKKENYETKPTSDRISKFYKRYKKNKDY